MTTPANVPVALSAQPVSLQGRLFANQTFHFETLRNAEYILSECADLGEILERIQLIPEGAT